MHNVAFEPGFPLLFGHVRAVSRNVRKSNTMLRIEENVQEVSKHASQDTATKPAVKPQRSFPKTHLEYWKARLFRNTYTRDGVTCEVAEWSAKIQHLGVRKTFALGSSNREVAAAKARDIYVSLIAVGWDNTLARYNPAMHARKDDPTIGEFLHDVETKGNLRTKTFRNYAACLRTIVAGVFDIDGGAERFNYRGGGNTQWRERIDGIRLTRLTPQRVQQWKVQFLRSVEGNPKAELSRRRTFNSYVRCARALFSSKQTKFLTVRLPSPLPFDGIEREKAGSMRYQSSIDPARLLADAGTELKDAHPNLYKMVLLGLCAGLRKAEMDSLQWSAIDFDKNSILVSNTDVLRLKSDTSDSIVDVEPEVLAELKELRPRTKGPFVLASKLSAKPQLARQYYRCQSQFQRLNRWLRSKGINSRKPLHELRKEFGSQINLHHGLHAASSALRHGDITTSARHYVAKKNTVTPRLGQFLVLVDVTNN